MLLVINGTRKEKEKKYQNNIDKTERNNKNINEYIKKVDTMVKREVQGLSGISELCYYKCSML